MSELPEWYRRTDRTWIDVFVERTDAHPEREFVKCGDDRLTYGELRREVDLLASGLVRSGVRPGGTVAVWMTNSIRWLIAQWATYRVGCALMPLSSYYRIPEAMHALKEGQPTALILQSAFIGKVDARAMVLEMLPELRTSEQPTCAQVPSLQVVVTDDDWREPGTRTWDRIRQLGDPVTEEGLAFAQRRTAPLDVMNYMYTSGTTGFPKAGISMHRNNMATLDLWAERGEVDERSVVLCMAPLFGNMGCMYASGLVMYKGCRFVLTERFDAERLLREVPAERVTYIVGTPEMWRMLIEHPAFGSIDLSSVVGGHIGGSALDPALAPLVFALAPRSMPCYGLSECGGIATVTGAWDDLDYRLNSVGRRLPCVKVEIHDAPTGERLPVGMVGEIWIADELPGSSVGKGYLASARQTANTITPEGWFRTGDLGRLDELGYLYFVGRVKSMFTVGGTNVYPAEVERVIGEHEGVRRAFVVGVPDDRLGSVPVAFIVGDANPDRLKASLKGELSSQKLPRHIWAVTEDEIPVTPLGKVRVLELVERANKLLGR